MSSAAFNFGTNERRIFNLFKQIMGGFDKEPGVINRLSLTKKQLGIFGYPAPPAVADSCLDTLTELTKAIAIYKSFCKSEDCSIVSGWVSLIKKEISAEFLSFEDFCFHAYEGLNQLMRMDESCRKDRVAKIFESSSVLNAYIKSFLTQAENYSIVEDQIRTTILKGEFKVIDEKMNALRSANLSRSFNSLVGYSSSRKGGRRTIRKNKKSNKKSRFRRKYHA